MSDDENRTTQAHVENQDQVLEEALRKATENDQANGLIPNDNQRNQGRRADSKHKESPDVEEIPKPKDTKDMAAPPPPSGRTGTRSNTRSKTGTAKSSGNASRKKEEPLSFYEAKSSKEIEYQDRTNNIGKRPGPGALRLQEDKLYRELGLSRVPTDVVSACMGPIPRDTFETLLKATVKRENRASNPLIRGLPMVEDVVFFRPKIVGDGNCYWASVSALIYGDERWWPRVKAQHKSHLDAVLKDKKHPRFGMYESLNKEFFDTMAMGPGRKGGVISTRVNAYQCVQAPFVYASTRLLEVTADVYGVFMVLYSIDKDQKKEFNCTHVRMAGAYNSRHIFMTLQSFHFRPMFPNDHYAWEFTCPRITRAVTGHRDTGDDPNLEKRREGPFHPWRVGYARAKEPYETERAPLLVDYACDADKIKQTIPHLL